MNGALRWSKFRYAVVKPSASGKRHIYSACLQILRHTRTTQAVCRHHLTLCSCDYGKRVYRPYVLRRHHLRRLTAFFRSGSISFSKQTVRVGQRCYLRRHRTVSATNRGQNAKGVEHQCCQYPIGSAIDFKPQNSVNFSCLTIICRLTVWQQLVSNSICWLAINCGKRRYRDSMSRNKKLSRLQVDDGSPDHEKDLENFHYSYEPRRGGWSFKIRSWGVVTRTVIRLAVIAEPVHRPMIHHL